jgi:hypothetical protein
MIVGLAVDSDLTKTRVIDPHGCSLHQPSASICMSLRLNIDLRQHSLVFVPLENDGSERTGDANDHLRLWLGYDRRAKL